MDQFDGDKLAEKIICWISSILIVLFLGWAISNWNRQDLIVVITLIAVAFLASLALIKIIKWRDKIHKQGYEQGYKDGNLNKK